MEGIPKYRISVITWGAIWFCTFVKFCDGSDGASLNAQIKLAEVLAAAHVLKRVVCPHQHVCASPLQLAALVIGNEHIMYGSSRLL